MTREGCDLALEQRDDDSSFESGVLEALLWRITQLSTNGNLLLVLGYTVFGPDLVQIAGPLRTDFIIQLAEP